MYLREIVYWMKTNPGRQGQIWMNSFSTIGDVAINIILIKLE